MFQHNKKNGFAGKLFFCINIIIAVLFILGCHVKWFDPAHWWFMGFFTLLSSYFLIILFTFFIVWLFIKPRRSLLFILVIVFNWQPICNIFPPRLPVAFVIKKQNNALRIMSWNVEQFEIMQYSTHPELKQEMFNLINTYQPDIACFQEMVCADSAIPSMPGLTTYYHKFGLYTLNDFIDSLHFPYHCYAYNPKENFLYNEHFGTIIFSKYPMIRKRIIRYYPYDYNSIFEYVDILKGNDTIRIFDVHLQSLHLTPSNLQYIDSPSLSSERDIESSESLLSKFKTGFLKRHKQAERIKAEVNKSPYPLILCGDFNDVPNSYAYETIGDGLQNAFVTKGAGIGRTFSGISSTLRIDNIFVGQEFSIQQFTRIHKRLSDHFPIITDVIYDPMKGL
jgi:endonuclease/exonuclease/phosphatase family metal-dependent hydrolase